jgi:hypothetical protein
MASRDPAGSHPPAGPDSKTYEPLKAASGIAARQIKPPE